MLRVPPSLSNLLPGTLQIPLQINGQTLELGNSATFTGATNQILATSAQIVYNVVAAQKHNFTVGGSGKAEISATGLFLSGSGELLNLGASGPLGSSISSSYNTISGRSTGLEITSGTGLPIKFFVYTSEYERINSGGLHEAYQLSLGGTIGSGVDPGRGGISLTNRLQFSGAGTADSTKSLIYADGSAGSLFVQVPTGKYCQGQVAGVGIFNLGRSGNTQGDANWAIGKYGGGLSHDGAGTGISGIGSNIYFNNSLTGHFQFCLNNGANLLDMGPASTVFYQPQGTEVGRFDSGGLTLTKNLYFYGAGAASAIWTTMWSDGSWGNLFTNVPTGKYEQHRVGGYGSLSLGRVGVTTGDSYWAIGLYNANGVAEFSVYGGISNELTTMILNVPTGNTIKFKYNAVEKYRFSAALAEFDRLSLGGTIGSSVDGGAGSLALTNRIQFAGTGTADSTKSLIYADAANGNLFTNTPTLKYQQYLVAGVALFSLGYALGAQADTYWAIGKYGVTGSTSETGIYGGGSTGIFHNVPTTYSHSFRVNNVEYLRLNAGGITITGGFSASAVSDMNASLRLGAGGNIAFNGAGTDIGGTHSGIWADGSDGNIYINAPTSKTITLLVAGSSLYTFSTGLVLADGVNIVPGSTTGTKIGTATTQKLGFFNATPVVQQTGGAATAGALYTATEQGMLQTVYDCLRTFGFLS